MSTENKSIHEFDFNLICEYYSSLERQGPGSPEATIKALSFIDNLTSESNIADIGCGTGGQTMVLAQHAPGQITGIDLSASFRSLFDCCNALAERSSLYPFNALLVAAKIVAAIRIRPGLRLVNAHISSLTPLDRPSAATS